MMSQYEHFRIITIDDNPFIHQIFIKSLTNHSINTSNELNNKKKVNNNLINKLPTFKIDSVLNGKDGVKNIKKQIKKNEPYALAFVDIRMEPDWDGIKTIKHILRLDSDIQIVICTAYSDYSWEETIENLGIRDNILILKKPFDYITLRQLTYALTKKWQLLRENRKYTKFLEQKVEKRSESLEHSLSIIRSTFESSRDGILVVDNKEKIIDYNKNFIDMWKIPLSLLKSLDNNIILEYVLDQLINPNSFLKVIKQLKNSEELSIDAFEFKDGRIFERYSRPHRLNNEIVGRVWNYRDVTKRIYLEKKIEHQATHDPLTNLPNRLLLKNKIQQAMLRADHHHNLMGLLFFDIDRFKLINDSLSHEAGDALLLAFSQRLRRAIRKHDTIARLGSDEFVIVMSEINNEESIKNRINKLSEIIRKPFNIFDYEIFITASIGISLYPKDSKNINALLRFADLAMDYAKEQNGDQYRFYTKNLHDSSILHLHQASELRRAIRKNEFFLYYQPQFDLVSEKIIAVEALIRWQKPDKSIASPLDFIPIAEEIGLIIPIGDWVLKTACKQNKLWQEKGLPPLRVAINVTTAQIRQLNFLDNVQKILEETQLKPEFLEIELTENVIISHSDIINTIIKLKEMGLQIVLDDYGTGNSSLSYLKKIPIDRLKIDKSFIQNIEYNQSDKAIIKAIIEIARCLNLKVLAEGVETENQLNFLKKENCREIQGFYFSKPLSASQLQNILIKYQTMKDFKINSLLK